MTQKAEIYLPAVARFAGDLEKRQRALEVVRNEGYRTGLMLVVRGPQDLTPESIQKQLDNLAGYTNLDKEGRPVVFVMHPNKPVTGEDRLNFVNNPKRSQDYVEQSIELASKLPAELTPATGKAVTFHLNGLVTPAEWLADPEAWQKTSERMYAQIKDIAGFAARHNVKIAVETVPVPEFGDMKRSDDTRLEGTELYWDQLGNPWNLLPWREEITKLREAGAGLSIDWCHSWVAMNTVDEVKRLAGQGMLSEALATYMIFESDLAHAGKKENFSDELVKITQDGDIWHANDARGIYRTPHLHGQYTNFEEGVPLYCGDIPDDQLDRLIRHGLQKPIKFVVEVHEDDFDNNPNSKASLEQILQKSK